MCSLCYGFYINFTHLNCVDRQDLQTKLRIQSQQETPGREPGVVHMTQESERSLSSLIVSVCMVKKWRN